MLISVINNCYSGTARVTREDLEKHTGGAHLPDENVMRTGDWKLIPKEPLKMIHRARDRAKNILAREGFSIGTVFAVEMDSHARIRAELAECQAEHAAAVDDLVDNLSSWYEKKEQQAEPATAALMRARRISPSEVKARCRLDYLEVPMERLAGQEDSYDRLIQQAAPELFADLSRDAAKAYRESFEARETLGQRALRPLRRLVNKMGQYRLVSPAVADIAKVYQRILDRLPNKGDLTEEQTEHCQMIMEQIATQPQSVRIQLMEVIFEYENRVPPEFAGSGPTLDQLMAQKANDDLVQPDAPTVPDVDLATVQHQPEPSPSPAPVVEVPVDEDKEDPIGVSDREMVADEPEETEVAHAPQHVSPFQSSFSAGF